MPRQVAKRYRDKAKALLSKEGLPLDEDRVNQLAIVLRDAKALDKPRVMLEGVIIVAYRHDELGNFDANLQYQFVDDKGNDKTPSAEFG